MKKFALLSGLAVATFVCGLLGTYFALPHIFPERVMEATNNDTLRAAGDSVAIASAQADTGLGMQAISTDSLNRLAARSHLSSQLRDTVRRYRNRVQTLQATADSLRTALAAAKSDEQSAAITSKRAESLSKAITAMEVRDMEGILQKIDRSVLKEIYQTASSRDRPRILRALPPDKAAAFVEQLVDPSLAEEAALAADSSQSPSTGESVQ